MSQAALGALRCVVVTPDAPVAELVAAFRAAAEASGEDPALAAILGREADLFATAAGQAPTAR